MRQTFSWLGVFSAISLLGTACAGDASNASGGAWALGSTAGKQLALGKAHGCSLDAAISGVLC